MRSPHDVGGEAAGPVDTADHAKTYWEQRIDAIRALTRDLCSTDELRRARESLGVEEAATLSYYERQIASMVQVFLEKGVVTVADLTRKLAEIESRSAS